MIFSVYSGHHSILVPPVEVEINPCIWLATVSHYKGNSNIDYLFFSFCLVTNNFI